MVNFFDKILKQNKLDLLINETKENVTIFEHHVKLKKLLTDLNQILQVEIKEIDTILVLELQKHNDLPSGVTHYINYIGKKMYGSHYKQVVSNYHKFVKGFTGYDTLESSLRKFFIQLIKNHCHFDIYSGKNNLIELSGRFIGEIDKWFNYIAKTQKYRTAVENFISDDLNGNISDFFDVLTFFICLLIISSFTLDRIKNGVLKTKHEKNFLSVVAKIFYGKTLSINQITALHKHNLDGCIAFRGLSLNIKNCIKLLANQTELRGTSWTTDYDLAVHFASQNNNESEIHKVFVGELGTKINSILDFVKFSDHLWKNKLFDRKYYLLFDDPGVLLKVLRLIFNSEKRGSTFNKNYLIKIAEPALNSVKFTASSEKDTIAVLFSYFIINDDVLLYLGDGAPEHFVNETIIDQKELAIVIPDKFKLDSNSFDAVVPIIIKELNLSYIPEGNFEQLKQVLSAEQLQLFKKILQSNSLMTFERMNFLLKKNLFDGKTIGLINKTLRGL